MTVPLNATQPQTLSLVIPIYNEAQHLESFLKLIDGIQFEIPKELVFIDDKSTDASLALLKAFPFQSQFKIVEQPINMGKGAALRVGIAQASGTFIGIQDADFEYTPDDIPSMLTLLVNNKADVVFGSRFKKNGLQVHRTFHYMINRLLTGLSNVLSGLYLTDMETCYKFFRADILKNISLESNRFGFEPEITAKIARLKIRVCEVPISYFPRNYLEGKKITWKDGIAALRHILYFNMLSRTRCFKPTMPTHYIPKDRNLL
jgi:glycosyltransferase involved in cell wall biosynthesis